jgi:hypothetical protein
MAILELLGDGRLWVNSGGLAVSRLLPIYSDEQTLAATDGMSRTGQSRAFSYDAVDPLRVS